MFPCLLVAQLVLSNSSVLQTTTPPLSNSTAAGSSMSVDYVGYGYAALVATGGVVGYMKAGSVPSLAAGLLFGGLAGVGAYQISNDPNNIWVSLGTAGTLSAVMGKRFYGSRKLFPAGVMAAASILMVGKLGLSLLQKPNKS